MKTDNHNPKTDIQDYSPAVALRWPLRALAIFCLTPLLLAQNNTNPITVFQVGKAYAYSQNSSAMPSGPSIYTGAATVALISNRTATSITVTLPTGANQTMRQTQPGLFAYANLFFDAASLNSAFPAGAYSFNVSGAPNQQLTVQFPVSLTPPPAPHVSNYAAAQSVNPCAPFSLSWDALPNPAGGDYIYLSIGGFFSRKLPPTASSFQIPAGTFSANSNYSLSLGFYRAVWGTNGDATTVATQTSETKLQLVTGPCFDPPPLSPPVLSNAQWRNGAFSFDVSASPGTSLRVYFRTNLTTAQWQLLTTTNPTTSIVRVVDPHSVTNRAGFYQAVNGQ